MTFDPNIPRPTDFLSTSQSNLLTNNQAIDASFNVDHTKFSDTTTHNGQHQQVTLYEGRLSPVLSFPASMLYTLTSGITPNQANSLWFSTTPETGSQSNFQLTNLNIVSGSNTGTAGGNLNYIDTPWNLRLYFGTTASFSSNNRTVIFPTAFSTILFSTATANNAAGTTIVTCLQQLSTLNLGTSNNSSVNWSAIGRL